MTTTSLFADLLLVVLVTTAAWGLPALARPSLPFGVRVPPGREADPVITGQRRRYARRVIVLAPLAGAATTLLHGLGRQGTSLIVPAGLGVAAAIAYYLAHRQIRVAKASEHWYRGTRQGTTTDTRLRTDPVRVPWPWLVPAALVLVATGTIGILHYGELPPTLVTTRGTGVDASRRVTTTITTAFTPFLVQALLTLLLPLLAAGLTRTRPELDAAQPAASARRYRIYLRWVVRLIAVTTAGANLTALFLALRLWELWTPSAPLAAIVYVPLGLATATWLVFEFRVGQAGHRLPADPHEDENTVTSPLIQRDDDTYWHLAGFIYANPADPALFVHQRAGGSSWTMNLGHSITRVVLTLAILVALLSVTGIIA